MRPRTPPRYRWLATLLALLVVPWEAMATVAGQVDVKPVEARHDNVEVAIDAGKRVTTIANGLSSQTELTASGNSGLARFLHAYTKTATSTEPPIVQPADLPNTFGVVPPDEAELPGTLPLSATLLDRQTALSAFSADTSTLVEAVASSCIDPVGAESCVDTPILSMRLPEGGDREKAAITPMLASTLAVAMGLVAFYRVRRSRRGTDKVQRRSRQERTIGSRGKAGQDAAPQRQARPKPGGVKLKKNGGMTRVAGAAPVETCAR